MTHRFLSLLLLIYIVSVSSVEYLQLDTGVSLARKVPETDKLIYFVENEKIIIKTIFVDGTQPEKLEIVLDAFEEVDTSYPITDETGNQVIYTTRNLNTGNRKRFYSTVPGTPALIQDIYEEIHRTRSIRFTPDGNKIIVLREIDFTRNFDQFQHFDIPSLKFTNLTDVLREYKFGGISLDSKYLIYSAWVTVDFSDIRQALFSLSLDFSDPSETDPIQITPLSKQGVRLTKPFMKISPDNSIVVYSIRQDNDFEELYSVPINGGTVTKINVPLDEGANEYIGSFYITEDSQTVVYGIIVPVDYHQPQRKLYSVSIDGTSNVLLDVVERLGGVIISPDLQTVIYALTNTDMSKPYTLHSVPILGGTPVRLDNFNQGAIGYKITLDSKYVIYQTYVIDPITGNRNLYIVPITGGDNVLLVPSNEFPSFHLFTPNGQYFIYNSQEIENSEYHKLYMAPVPNDETFEIYNNTERIELYVDTYPLKSVCVDNKWLVVRNSYGGTTKEMFSIEIAKYMNSSSATLSNWILFIANFLS